MLWLVLFRRFVEVNAIAGEAGEAGEASFLSGESNNIVVVGARTYLLGLISC